MFLLMKPKRDERSARIRWIARAGTFTALSVALGYLLVFIPNVELISASIFASGWLFGSSVGLTVGALSFAIFSFFNPLGASLPPLLLAQIVGGMLLGATGGFLKSFLSGVPLIAKGIVLGIGGGLLTLVYDVITNIGGFIAFTTEKTFLAYLAAGIAFSLLHIFSNTLIFALLLFPVLNRVASFHQRGGVG
jgi:uncharacterized membrane protein